MAAGRNNLTRRALLGAAFAAPVILGDCTDQAGAVADVRWRSRAGDAIVATELPMGIFDSVRDRMAAAPARPKPAEESRSWWDDAVA